MGVSNKKFPSAIEALLRRVLKEEKPFHINALVDFYHTVSLQYVVPVGGFDLGALHAPLEARLTRDGDLFQALDDELPQSLPPGEVAYASGQTILTRHLMWRQARTGLLTHATHSAVLVAEVPGDIEEEIAEAVQTALRTGQGSRCTLKCLLPHSSSTNTIPRQPGNTRYLNLLKATLRPLKRNSSREDCHRSGKKGRTLTS